MAAQHTSGDQVFLDSGQIVEFVAAVPEGVIVRPIFGDEDEEPHYGKPITVSAVYAEAPVPKFSAEVVALHEQAAALRADLAAMRAERVLFEREEQARRERIALHGHLKTLDDFLAGKITHVVTAQYDNVRVRTIDAAMADREFQSSQPLVCLEGKLSCGRATWTINNRGYETFCACTSDAEAVAVARAYFDERFAHARSGRSPRPDIDKLILSAKIIGHLVPDDIAERQRAAKLAQAAEAVAAAEKALEAKRVELAAIQPEQVPA